MAYYESKCDAGLYLALEMTDLNPKTCHYLVFGKMTGRGSLVTMLESCLELVIPEADFPGLTGWR